MMPFMRSLLCTVATCLACAVAADEARFRVTDTVVAPPTEGITATIDDFGFGQMTRDAAFEPLHRRDWIRASRDAPPSAPGRILAPPATISKWNTLRDGALDGARIEVLRLVDGRLETVRTGRVPEGGHAVSGWFRVLARNRLVPPGASGGRVRVAAWERPGRPRWFSVRAVDRAGRLSAFSAPAEIRLPDALSRPEREPPEFVEHDHDADAPASEDGPAAPTGLSARYDARTGHVVLSWDAAAARGVAGFALYQSYVPPEEMEGFFIDTEGEGASIRAGDWIALRSEHLAPEAKEKLVSDRIWGARESSIATPRSISFGGSEADWRILRHPEDAPPPWGGVAHARVALDARETFTLRTGIHSGTGQDFYRVLRPGVAYEISARVRGSVPGRMAAHLGWPLYKPRIPLGTAEYGTGWTEIRIPFRIPRNLEETDRLGVVELTLAGPARIDVDEVRIRPADAGWLDYSDTDHARLSDAGVSALRTHGWIKTGTATYDLRGLLAGGRVPGTRGAPDMFHTLSMMERAGLRPWLQIEPHLSRAEWLGLVEYLAAPFDPETEDPADKPWAALRVRQGRAAPWTESFDRILFELGNETWNRLFRPWVFEGMTDAATGRRYGRGEVYGLFQSRVAEILRSSPHWDAALEDQVTFVIGGWAIRDYGTHAARFAPDASELVTVAAYNGGWDEDEGPPRRDATSYANVLSQVVQGNLPRAVGIVASVEALAAEQGREIAVGTYEAGPGYAMDGLNRQKVTEEQADAQEHVMKSRAAGVATLDSFLAQRQAGFRTQNFFTFGEGVRWKSHAHWHEGGEAYPSWALLSLMNAVADGEMLAVETQAVPVRDLREFRRRIAVEDAPQVALYATRTSDRLTLLAVSRRVPGYPDPAEDGCTPVTIELPAALPPGPVTLHRTGGAYDDTGADGDPPPIETVVLPRDAVEGGRLEIGGATGAPECGLPAAAAYVYVIGNPDS